MRRGVRVLFVGSLRQVLTRHQKGDYVSYTNIAYEQPQQAMLHGGGNSAELTHRKVVWRKKVLNMAGSAGMAARTLCWLARMVRLSLL